MNCNQNLTSLPSDANHSVQIYYTDRLEKSLCSKSEKRSNLKNGGAHQPGDAELESGGLNHITG